MKVKPVRRYNGREAIGPFRYGIETDGGVYDFLTKRYVSQCCRFNQEGVGHWAVGLALFKNKKQQFKVNRLVFDNYNLGPAPEIVDHKNGNPFDNRFENLRGATRRQNATNRKIASTNTSGTTGVYLRKKSGKWQARISLPDGKRKSKDFVLKEDAIAWRKEQEKIYYGEFIRQ